MLALLKFTTTRTIRAAVIGVGCMVAGTAQADCDAPLTQTQLAAIAWEARSAFEEMDQEKFMNLMDQLNQSTPCASEVIDPMGASTIHLLMGLGSFGKKDLEGATLAFAAARSSSKGFQMPDGLAPTGHPLQAAFSIIPLADSPTQDVVIDSGTTMFVDGKESTTRSAVWPALIQFTQANGAVLQTAYVLASEPVSGAPAPVVAAVEDSSVQPPAGAELSTLPLPAKSVLPPTWRTPLLGVAGAAVLTTAVLQILASRTAQTYWDQETGEAELDDLRSRTNSLNSASVATGVLSAGALATVSLTWEW